MQKEKRQPAVQEKEEHTSSYVVQSYLVSTAVYDFNVYEKRILYVLVKLVQNQVEEKKLAGRCKVTPELLNYQVTIPISCLLLNGQDKNHSRIKEALVSLSQKSFDYQDDEQWQHFSIIAFPSIRFRSSEVSFTVCAKMWEALLNFTKGFSRYDLNVAFSLKSPYSMRLYEMMSSQKGPITYGIDKIRMIFKLEEKYARTKDLIHYVLENAQRELDEKSPVSFTFKEVKTGKKVTAVRFFPVKLDRTPEADQQLRAMLNRYGVRGMFSTLEMEYLEMIGFTEAGIKNNFRLLQTCKKHYRNFAAELSLLLGQSRGKSNPCGWVIRTLHGRLKDRHVKIL